MEPSASFETFLLKVCCFILCGVANLLRPEWRNRCYFVGTNLGCLAQAMADIQKLQKHFQDNPRRHHILSCCSSDAVGQDLPDEPSTEDAKVQAACDYFACFNKAFQSARSAKRIDDAPLRPHADRASAQSKEMRLTQWMRSWT